MSTSDGTMRPWDLDRYRPGAGGALRPPRPPSGGGAGGGGGDWDGSIPDDKLTRPAYEDDGTSLLGLALWTAFLTVMTLGIYRFWMITRLRRYYWRAVRIEGDRLEYTGRGIEKFLGFLLAILLLAIYLGLVNLALTFIGLSLGSEIALNLSILSALPLYFFAVYRARRYVMARTRWRGIRFGMESGAWGYTVRALGYTLLTLLTGGLLYPLMHFRLEKYMADRTWYGDLKFEQEGSWLGLFAHWIWIYVVLALMGMSVWGLYEAPADDASQLIGVVTIVAGSALLMILFLFYQVAAFRYLWSNRRLGETSFANDISASSVLGIYIGGSLLVGFLSFVVGGVLGMAGFALLTFLGGFDPANVQQLGQAAEQEDIGAMITLGLPFAVGIALTYVVIAASAYAFGQVFIRQPIIRRMAERMTIHNPRHLRTSRQRAHDPAAEAGGFADALGVDVGAGF